jgi:site-specific DNA-adenine methylase
LDYIIYIAKDENKLKKLYENLQKNYNSEDKKKEAYDKIDMLLNVENRLFKQRIYKIKANLFPMLSDGKRSCSLKTLDGIINAPIIDFIRNADIIFTNKNAIDVYKEYKDNEKAFIFLDPPYLISCNSFYKSPNLEIYEYLFDNPINNNEAYIILCLENNWIIKLLFKNNHSVTYSKKYETSHRNTEHIIILNKISSII